MPRDRSIPTDQMPAFVDEGPVEAVADAWASIEGWLHDFRSGRGRDAEAHGGRYAGFCSDADELVRRLRDRGYIVVKQQ